MYNLIKNNEVICGIEYDESGRLTLEEARGCLTTQKESPTDAEIQAELTRLQAEYDSKQYARDRAADYPSIADQLDTLYHGGIDAWKAEVKVVKDKYPKG